MRRTPPLVRFMAKVDQDGPNGCWVWTAYRNHGYGRFTVEQGRTVWAYRWAYEHFVGPVDEGLELDHVCRNRACVNPSHLEPVTHGENMRRANARTTCIRFGHPLTRMPSGQNLCVPCRQERESRTKRRPCVRCGTPCWPQTGIRRREQPTCAGCSDRGGGKTGGAMRAARAR